MPLKFAQLQVGQTFHFEGVAYVKSTPLMAHRQSDGQSRLIPRSALVQVEGEEPAPAPAPQRDIPLAEVQRAWAEFQRRCAVVLAVLNEGVDPTVVAALQREFAEARAEFEQTLGL